MQNGNWEKSDKWILGLIVVAVLYFVGQIVRFYV